MSFAHSHLNIQNTMRFDGVFGLPKQTFSIKHTEVQLRRYSPQKVEVLKTSWIQKDWEVYRSMRWLVGIPWVWGTPSQDSSDLFPNFALNPTNLGVLQLVDHSVQETGMKTEWVVPNYGCDDECDTGCTQMPIKMGKSSPMKALWMKLLWVTTDVLPYLKKY